MQINQKNQRGSKLAGNPNIKPVPNAPNFRYNAAAKRYIGSNGRFVKVERIRGALDAFITGTVEQIEVISTQLLSGEISLAQWQTEMMLHVKNANLAGASLERGGWYNMSQADFGKMGQKIRGEYEYLRTFANQIEAGTQPLDGRLVQRARLYGEQSRVSYYEFASDSAKKDGFAEEKSILTPSESCGECIQEASRGWVPLGDLIPIGERECLSNCNCYMQYRKAGETRTA